MATKQELEAQIAELQKQLADQTPADVLSLKEELAGRTARALSLEAERDALRGQISERDSQIDLLENQLGSLQAKLRVIGDKSPAPISGDSVVLAGQKYDIIMRERVDDFIHLWRKRYVQDDDLVLIVKKS